MYYFVTDVILFLQFSDLKTADIFIFNFFVLLEKKKVFSDKS